MPISPPLRILIAEDSLDDAELLQLELTNSGFDFVATRVQTAEEMRTALQERWNLVLTDFSMPGFSAERLSPFAGRPTRTFLSSSSPAPSARSKRSR